MDRKRFYTSILVAPLGFGVSNSNGGKNEAVSLDLCHGGKMIFGEKCRNKIFLEKRWGKRWQGKMSLGGNALHLNGMIGKIYQEMQRLLAEKM